MKLQDRHILWLACALLFSVAASFCIWTGDKTNWPDERAYINIAKRLVAGLGFVNHDLSPTAYRPPGYPYVISLVFHIYESPLLAKLVNVIALTSTAYLLSLIVKRVTPSGQMFAPILVLVSPIHVYASSTLYPQIFGGFLFVLGIFLLLIQPRSASVAFVSGISFGALILVIPSFTLVFVCLVIMLIIRNASVGGYTWSFIGVLALSTVVFAGAWVLRNSLTFDRFVFISTNSGVNLLYGNSENAEYDTGVVDISKYSDVSGMNEVEIDNYYKRAAINWVVNHPLEAAGLYVKKVANYFNFRNKFSINSESTFFRSSLLFVTYYPLLLMALIRGAMWRKYKFTWTELLLYALYFGNAFISAIVYTRIRYRIPFDFLLIAIAAIFLGYMRESMRLRAN